MTDYVVSDGSLTSVADAIRAKGGTSAPLAFPAGFVSAIQAFPDAVTLDSLSVTENGTYTPSSGHAFSEVTVSVSGGGGGHEDEDGIITRTISGTYTNSRVTEIGRHAFANCSSLTTISFPVCTTLDVCAFFYCSRLTSAIFSACTYISTSVFYSCYSLTTISFPVCITVSSNAFADCRKLTTVSFPSCSRIGSVAFSKCYTLLSAYFLGSSVPTLSNSNAFTSTPHPQAGWLAASTSKRQCCRRSSHRQTGRTIPRAWLA